MVMQADDDALREQALGPLVLGRREAQFVSGNPSDLDVQLEGRVVRARPQVRIGLVSAVLRLDHRTCCLHC